jgi:hypothetical protein
MYSLTPRQWQLLAYIVIAIVAACALAVLFLARPR